MQEGLVSYEENLDNLAQNKTYYMEDPDGSYCQYYKVTKIDGNTLDLMPLYSGDADGEYVSGYDGEKYSVTRVKIYEGNVTELNKLGEKNGIISELDLTNLTVGQYWEVACEYGEISQEIEKTTISIVTK